MNEQECKNTARIVGSVIRHGVLFAGAWLLKDGVAITPEIADAAGQTAEIVVGSVCIAASQVWSFINIFGTTKK